MIYFKNTEIKKTAADTRALLLSFLSRKTPRLTRMMVWFWDKQHNNITYKQMREALEAGVCPPEFYDQWRQEYSELVMTALMPAWQEAIVEGRKQLLQRFPGRYQPSYDEMISWTADHAANWVIDITETQRKAINGLIQRATTLEGQTTDSLAKVIRPTIGLYPQQATANLRYYERVRAKHIDSGLSAVKAEEKALRAAVRYGEKQHRYRAQMIARTELVAAYNVSEQKGVEQAIKDGYMSRDTIKRWSTADDDRVCEHCKELEGKEVPVNALFSNGFLTPPAHPNCRCAVEYIDKDDLI